MLLLRVTGRSFCCGAVFEKREGEWAIKWIAPYLRRIIANVPIKDLGNYFTSKGFSYEWIL